MTVPVRTRTFESYLTVEANAPNRSRMAIICRSVFCPEGGHTEKSMSHPKRAAAESSPPAPTTTTLSLPPEALINSAEVRLLCGIKSTMSLWRWVNKSKLNFPKPIKIGERNFWRRAAVVKWIANRERATIGANVSAPDDEPEE